MPPEERERFYFYFGLIFVLLSPLTIFVSMNSSWQVAFAAHAALLIIPITVLFDIFLHVLTGRTLRGKLWVRHPRATARNRLQGNQAACIQLITERLEQFNFQYDITPEGDGLTLWKSKDTAIHSFLGNEFAGQARLSPDGDGCLVEIELIEKDILLIETGEFDWLQKLAEYFCRKSDSFILRDTPLILHCGVNLAILCSVAAFANYWQLGIGEKYFLNAYFVSAGLALFAMVKIHSDREHLFGYRLGFVGLYLSFVPILGLLLKYI